MFRIGSLVVMLAGGLAVALGASGTGGAGPSGPIAVIDGDTFDIGGTRVRLFGVDAPEGAQTCTLPSGSEWECGAWVTSEVALRFDGRQATCEQVDTDRYGRVVARCSVDRMDLGATLVEDGLATAYRRYSWDYDLQEKAAQLAGVGIWRGEVQEPAAFRADQRPAPQAVQGACIIKGNISASGRIYHMPHNRDYDRTRIDTVRGERWFCSEAEARAAGWRAARN